MRPIRLLLIFFAVVFLGAALIAPGVYQFVQILSARNDFFHSLSRQPFHRYVNRCLIFFAVIGLWPFFRALGLKTWSDFGFAPPATNWKKIPAGFFLGFGSLAVLATASLIFGVRQWQPMTINALFVSLFLTLLTAFAVAILEEAIFRGAIFSAIRRTASWLIALAVSSAIYAIVHFFARPPPPETIKWFSGFVALGGMFRGFVDWPVLVPGFFNLLIVGAILALAYQRTGDLYFSIGLHAGWIFSLKSYGALTKKAHSAHLAFFGSFKIVDGWLATLVLSLVFILLFLFQKKTKDVSDAR
ncbi:MAG: CPBP family intramembrane glutamic endopeptidase [Verrucomicrobiota bacterium]